jgi:predicted RNase H-like nuclease (RuvC/YqgF family)
MKRTFAQVEEERKETELSVWVIEQQADRKVREAKRKIAELEKELTETDDYKRVQKFKALFDESTYRVLFEGGTALLNLHTIPIHTVEDTVDALYRWRDAAVITALEGRNIMKGFETDDSKPAIAD